MTKGDWDMMKGDLIVSMGFGGEYANWSCRYTYCVCESCGCSLRVRGLKRVLGKRAEGCVGISS